jgi:site-specific recombinase XerD
MNTWPNDDGDAIERHLQQLRLRSRDAVAVYRCVLRGFQRFVRERDDAAVGIATLQAWLRGRTAHWRPHLLAHRARIVDRFLDFLQSEAALAINPLAQLRERYAQRWSTPIVRALLTPDPLRTLEALRPPPQFGSFLGDMLRRHVELMRAIGYRYEAQSARLLRFDRFLQGRPELAGQPPKVLLQQWAAQSRTPNAAWECEQTARTLERAWRRLDPAVELARPDRALERCAKQQQRRPYIYSPQELRLLLETARRFPSPLAALRPHALHTMLVLAGCAGLRLGELARLDLGDIDLEAGVLEVRKTKFFKSRTLPLSGSVTAILREYLDARRRAGAPQDGDSGLFWHQQAAGRYSRVMIEKLLVEVLRRAGLKPDRGRCGPRIHDLRHAFVVYRMLAWYRQGIEPQARLPYLATYLGHKDIHSTLVYLTVTQQLLQLASERFRQMALQQLHATAGVGR